jgi:hypothetical protein
MIAEVFPDASKIETFLNQITLSQSNFVPEFYLIFEKKRYFFLETSRMDALMNSHLDLRLVREYQLHSLSRSEFISC